MTTKTHFGPFIVDVENCAIGLLKLFTQTELDVLRFGMLPARKMETLVSHMETIFSPGVYRDPDTTLEFADRMIEVSASDAKRYLAAAVKAITTSIYSKGELIV